MALNFAIRNQISIQTFCKCVVCMYRISVKKKRQKLLFSNYGFSEQL